MGSVITGVIVAIVVIILLGMSIKIIQEYERGVIFRL
jgi:regulator of protease activity HflC (stomatin/prohibitin superfamily)